LRGKGGTVKNRSRKAVNSVQLRWSIVSLDDPTKVLLEDNLPFANFWAEADSAKVIEIPTLYPLPYSKPWRRTANSTASSR
jgi:hypothetical protein